MSDGGDAPSPGRRASRLVAALAAGILFAPAVVFAFGGRGHPIENRSKVEFSGLDEGWHSFTAFGGFVADRLPVRAQAVRADAWVDEHAFGEDPAFGGGSSPRVLRGQDGFLFIADAIDNACAPNAPASETVANLRRFASIISTSGRDVLTMVAPDKSAVHPELLPESFAKSECFDAYEADLWPALATAGIPGYVDLRARLRAESTASREPLYLRKDSHWDSAGSLVAVHAAIDALAPGLWRDDEVSYGGLADYTGDLTGLQGNPETDQAPVYRIERSDVINASVDVIDDLGGGFNRRFVNTAPAGRLIPGRTVMFLDSYGLTALAQIVPFFEDLTVVRLLDFAPEKYEALIADADLVWVMSVERSLAYRLSYEVGSPEFLDALEASLPDRQR